MGTQHENEWYVYHDALSLFTSTNSIAYMKQKNYFQHLILPENGLNNKINGSSNFANRVVGNHFEMMPLDSHLNQDLHKSVDVHTIITKSLNHNDPLKFSKRTPKVMSSAYRRIWDPRHGPNSGCPASNRICEDINRVVDEVYLSIYKNRGRALHGAHTCASRRRRESGNRGHGHGGKRIKKYDNEDIGWIHPSVAYLVDDVVAKYRC